MGVFLYKAKTISLWLQTIRHPPPRRIKLLVFHGPNLVHKRVNMFLGNGILFRRPVCREGGGGGIFVEREELEICGPSVTSKQTQQFLTILFEMGMKVLFLLVFHLSFMLSRLKSFVSAIAPGPITGSKPHPCNQQQEKTHPCPPCLHH